MSVRVMSQVWSNGPSDSTQRFVLLALADSASDDGSNAYPSISTLAQKCALSDRTVIRALDGLVSTGYLTRQRRKDTSNMYQIVLSKLVSDKMTHTNMTDCHPISDKMTHTVVTERHGTGDTVSYKPSYNHPINHQENRGEGASRAPKPQPSMTANLHPAVKAMYQVTTIWPGEITHPIIIEAIGDAPDIEVLGKVYAKWVSRGYNPRNYEGICGWYQELKRNPRWTPQATNGKTQAPAESDGLWQKALNAITAGQIDDERLKSAIKAIGGSSAIRAANEFTTGKLKERLYHEYTATPA